MRVIRTVKHAEDMPLYGVILRVARGKYQVVIKAVASKRTINAEELSLPSIPAVKAFFEREYPTLTWGLPKFPKPRIKRANPVSKSNGAKQGRKKNPSRKLPRKGDRRRSISIKSRLNCAAITSDT